MLDDADKGEMVMHLLHTIERDARELLHRVEVAQDMLGNGKVSSAAFYAIMMRASNQACRDSLEALLRISQADEVRT